jgi:hypothetical protein
LFKSDLDTIFYKRGTWKCRSPQEEVNLRTGEVECRTWNKALGMELFESDYEMIWRNHLGWKECPDHSFAKIMTRFFPAISVALSQVHLRSNIETRKQFENFAFYDKIRQEQHGGCHVPRAVRNFSSMPSYTLSHQLLHHQGACVGSIALLSALYTKHSLHRIPKSLKIHVQLSVLRFCF